jgi:RND family efflux transporter MFP subunit
MMNTTTRWMLGFAASAALLSAAGCGARNEVADASARKGAPADTALLAAADVAVATRMDLSAGVPVSGPLAPGWRAHVTSPSDDVVQDVLVREGQRVGKGQALARFRMGSVEADAASAHAALKSAAADWERQKNLLKEGAVSERDVEAAEANYRAAAAQDELASRRQLDATVRAPGAGTVTTRSVQSGDRVGKGDPLFVVADTRELEFEATVPSEFVPLVKVGAPVKLSLSGYAEGTISGRVARINSTADPATRQVKVYVTVPNPGSRLVGDLYATGNILVERATGVLAVPAAAIHVEDAGPIVWIVDKDGRAAKRTVKPGLRDGQIDRVQVLSGLAEGDRVVVGPVEGLVSGQPVHVAGKER